MCCRDMALILRSCHRFMQDVFPGHRPCERSRAGTRGVGIWPPGTEKTMIIDCLSLVGWGGQALLSLQKGDKKLTPRIKMSQETAGSTAGACELRPWTLRSTIAPPSLDIMETTPWVVNESMPQARSEKPRPRRRHRACRGRREAGRVHGAGLGHGAGSRPPKLYRRTRTCDSRLRVPAEGPTVRHRFGVTERSEVTTNRS